MIASLLAVSLLFNLLTVANAASQETGMEKIFSMDGTEIYYYETTDGDKVFLQYVDGVITQKDTVPSGSSGIVRREFLSGERTGDEDVISAEDYVSVYEGDKVMNPAPRIVAGTINYKALIDTGAIYYGLRCSWSSETDDSTYVIRSYIGTVIDLAAILASSTNLLAKFATTFIKKVCVNAGITLVGGAFKMALSTTVACKRTTYTWTLVDTTFSAHYKNVYGYDYYVTDSKYHTGEMYYEGYVPKDWGKQALAIWLHNEMFSYSHFSVVSWG